MNETPPPTPGSDDATVFRDDATVLRSDHATLSETGPEPSDHSWRGVSGVAGEADAPKVLKQRFVLDEKIGSGGMGTVFKAKDLRKVEARDAQPFVAIKVLNNDFRQHPEAFIALEREASKSQTLRHSNIVSIFDFDKDGDLPFITMQLLQGKELSEWLREYPSGLPEDIAWSVIEDMVSGLGHAHAEGVVHADFKPGNVYVCEDQSAKVLDFGIARAVRSNHVGEDTDFDPARLAALTPAYASREMLNGDNPEPRDDLYSLGVVIYMVLTGRHPFGRVPATDAAHEGMRAERVRGLSRQRWRTLSQCLAFNRSDRPADIQAVYDGLFRRPQWYRLSAVASLVLLAGTVMTTVLYEPPDISEVRQEVRQATLVDAETQRLDTLLTEQMYSLRWLQDVLVQHDQVLELDAASDGSLRLSALLIEQLQSYLKDQPELTAVVDIVEASRSAVAAQQLRAPLDQALEARLLTEYVDLAQTPISDDVIDRLLKVQEMTGRYLPQSAPLDAAATQLADQLIAQLPELAQAQPDLAAFAWSILGVQVVDAEQRSGAFAEIVSAAENNAAQLARQQVLTARTQYLQRLDTLLNVSCLRLDVPAVDEFIRQRPAEHRRALTQHAGKRMQVCAERITALDPIQAADFLRIASAFLPSRQQGVQQDPCALNSVGAGVPSAATCTDRFKLKGDTVVGPQLVVVPKADGDALAVAKYELSWGELNLFCEQTGVCEATPADDLPVTGIAVSLVEQYAQWLSQQTGFRYRLPTWQEWSSAAIGEPDPNRNCYVDVAGVRRGSVALAVDSGAANAFGLVHLFGNAREVVAYEDGYQAVGGGFNDPIEQCRSSNRQTIADRPDPQVGFRLVREVS